MINKMWFKRKTKKEKQRELQEELDELNSKYQNEINSYCKINNFIFIFLGFMVLDNRICVKFIDKDTPKNCSSYFDMDAFLIKYDTVDFHSARFDFLKFKKNLEQIGLELKKIE
jgi:hypothetical protein